MIKKSVKILEKNYEKFGVTCNLTFNANKVGCEDFFTKTGTLNVKLQRL